MQALQKVWSFLRSMRFGIGLLAALALLSVVGTVIPQEKTVAWYAMTYPKTHGVILMLGLNKLYQSWYYLALVALLALNLTLCSAVRLRTLARSGRDEQERAARLPVAEPLTEEQTAVVRQYLRERRCVEREIAGVSVFSKHRFGRYGTFVTHLGILLVVLFGAAALYLPEVRDLTCLPGEALTLEDGTQILVEAFRIEDGTGKLDYASELRVTLPSGKTSDSTSVRVNHPLAFGPYKIYQQTYGTAGSITVTDTASGGTDTFVLTDAALLSQDGVNGLWFEAVYAGVETEADGSLALITSSTGSYADPVYALQVAVDGGFTPMLAFPGDEITVGDDLLFHVNAPVEYPGLRVKYTPGAVNTLLIFAFVVLTMGLFVSLFFQPVLVMLAPEGYAVAGVKPEGMRVELEQLLETQSGRGETLEK